MDLVNEWIPLWTFHVVWSFFTSTQVNNSTPVVKEIQLNHTGGRVKMIINYSFVIAVFASFISVYATSQINKLSF
jgi:hypothetical protein